MLDETDPLVRAARAPFQEIGAALDARFDTSRAAHEAALAEHRAYTEARAERERQAAERASAPEPAPDPKRPPRRAPRPQRRESDDPSDTGFYSVSWMTKR